MKSLILMTSLLSLSFSLAAKAQDTEIPTKTKLQIESPQITVPGQSLGPSVVGTPLSTAYIPTGFDDNDRVQITVEGLFMDSCSQVGPFRTKFNAGEVSILQMAYRYAGMCLEMVVPFNQVVDLGIVKEGKYSIVDETSGDSLGMLSIQTAKTSTPDEFLYAPVSDITVDNDKVLLQGTFTDSCFKFKEIRTKVTKNVIEVLPIVEHGDPKNCKRGRYPFQQITNLGSIQQGRYLLHVRSLEGQAINKVIETY